jgi:hypothetical protein
MDGMLLLRSPDRLRLFGGGRISEHTLDGIINATRALVALTIRAGWWTGGRRAFLTPRERRFYTPSLNPIARITSERMARPVASLDVG